MLSHGPPVHPYARNPVNFPYYPPLMWPMSCLPHSQINPHINPGRSPSCQVHQAEDALSGVNPERDEPEAGGGNDTIERCVDSLVGDQYSDISDTEGVDLDKEPDKEDDELDNVLDSVCQTFHEFDETEPAVKSKQANIANNVFRNIPPQIT